MRWARAPNPPEEIIFERRLEKGGRIKPGSSSKFFSQRREDVGRALWKVFNKNFKK